jgi:hypothetical protein
MGKKSKRLDVTYLLHFIVFIKKVKKSAENTLHL